MSFNSTEHFFEVPSWRTTQHDGLSNLSYYITAAAAGLVSSPVSITAHSQARVDIMTSLRFNCTTDNEKGTHAAFQFHEFRPNECIPFFLLANAGLFLHLKGVAADQTNAWQQLKILSIYLGTLL